MQIVSLKPLVERFRAGTFRDEEVGPYFLAYVILEASMWIFAYGEFDPWNLVGSMANVIITLLGVLHLKKRNRGSFGNGFLNRYFALGWVIAVCMLLIGIPLGVGVFALSSAVAGEELFPAVGLIFNVVFAVLFYWWLGVAFAESQRDDREPAPAA